MSTRGIIITITLAIVGFIEVMIVAGIFSRFGRLETFRLRFAFTSFLVVFLSYCRSRRLATTEITLKRCSAVTLSSTVTWA